MGIDTGYPVRQGPGPQAVAGMQAPPTLSQYASVGIPGLYPQPLQGLPMRGPAKYPAQNEVVLGYEIYQPGRGCCQCDGLSPAGVVAIVVLLIFFPLLAWIPCVLDSCFEVRPAHMVYLMLHEPCHNHQILKR
eukprot:jgi/Botrbrau1/22392/Bobra.0091s0003.1